MGTLLTESGTFFMGIPELKWSNTHQFFKYCVHTSHHMLISRATGFSKIAQSTTVPLQINVTEIYALFAH